MRMMINLDHRRQGLEPSSLGSKNVLPLEMTHTWTGLADPGLTEYRETWKRKIQ